MFTFNFLFFIWNKNLGSGKGFFLKLWRRFDSTESKVKIGQKKTRSNVSISTLLLCISECGQQCRPFTMLSNFTPCIFVGKQH